MMHTAPLVLGMVDMDSQKVLVPEQIFAQDLVNRFSLALRLLDEKVEFFESAINSIDQVLENIGTELEE